MKNVKIIKDIFVILSGTLVAQAIPILISPLLTRYYTPEDFGVLAFFISIVSVLAVAVSGRYNLTIMLPKKGKEAFGLLVLSIGVSIFVTSLLLIGIFIFQSYIFSIPTFSKIGNWLYISVLTGFLYSLYQIFTFYYNRNEKYKEISRSKITQGIITGGGSLLLIPFCKTFNGLIFGYTLGIFSAILFLLYKGKYMLNFFTEYFLRSKKEIKENLFKDAINYKDYPTYSLLGALANSFGTQFPIFLFTYHYSASIVGYYSLTNRVVQLPATLLSFALAQVLYKYFASKKHEDQNMQKVFLKSSLYLALVPLPFILLLLFAAPQLFTVVFGEEWRSSGVYAQILVVSFWIKFVISPLSSLFAVQGSIKVGALWQYCYFFSTIITLGLCIYYEMEFTRLLLIYCIHEIVMYIFYYFIILRITGNSNINNS